MLRVVIPVVASIALGMSGCRAAPGLAAAPRPTPPMIDGFVARDFRGNAVTTPYRLFVPPGYDTATAYPLIVWLHGGGGAGDDNIKQVSGDQVPGTHSWTTPAAQAAHPAFVVAPQARGVWSITGHTTGQSPSLLAVLGIVRSIQDEYHIDRRRIYVAGQSLGGGGTWTLITSEPNPFAAAIVLCGVSPDTMRAAAAVSTPVWVFQGAQDTESIVQEARAMVAAVRRAGGHPKYTEYPGLDHNIWDRVFQEPGLVDWLFGQHK